MASDTAGSARTLDLVAALVAGEAAVGEAVFVTSALAPVSIDAGWRASASAADAIAAATSLARQGKRSSVILERGELLACLGPIAAAASERAAITVHVVTSSSSAAYTGRAEIVPALELGAGVLVSWGLEDALDTALVARRAAEDSETPFLHVIDAAIGSLGVRAFEAADVLRFLGPPRTSSSGSLVNADEAARKRVERTFAARAPFALGSATRELSEMTGRPMASLERQDTQDAEEIIVALGAAVPPARALAAALRAGGRKVGVLAVRALRPFSAVDAVKAVARARAIVVLEPLDVALAPCGPVASALKAAFTDALTWAPGFPGVGRIPPIVSAGFATIAGSIGESDIGAALAEMAIGDRARRLISFGSDGGFGNDG